MASDSQKVRTRQRRAAAAADRARRFSAKGERTRRIGTYNRAAAKREALSPDTGESGRTLAAHALELGRELGVRVALATGQPFPLYGGGAWTRVSECDELIGENGTAHVPHWDGGERAYWVALHELGHAATDAETPWSMADPLPSEHAAWAWAEQNALIPMSPAVERFRDECLASYGQAPCAPVVGVKAPPAGAGSALARRLSRGQRQRETIRRQRFLAMQLGRTADKHGA